LDILRCVSTTATKLNSWNCGNKLIKASCDTLKINPRIKNYEVHKNPIQVEEGMSNKNWTLQVSLLLFHKKGFDNS